MASRILVTYLVRCAGDAVAERARAIAVEQSVEMPVSAIDDSFVLDEIVGRVADIEERAPGLFAVRIALATQTVGTDAGQLLNMLFGNSSLHDDLVLQDVELPDELVAMLGGPRHGLAGLRERVDAGRRALTCSALKPQGLPPAQLAELARRFADGGIDTIKDDHGFAEQDYAPFAARATAIAAALHSGGHRTRYIPSLSGDLDSMRRQIALARAAGIDAVMVAPMIAGFSNMQTLVRENVDMAFITHPTMAGAARIAPELLIGKLFKLLGADALVFPNHGGRFGYSPQTCAALAANARSSRQGLRPAAPVPAGGMTPARVSEILDFYGADTMLLIGGGLLAARERLTAETAAFVAAVKDYAYE